MCNPEIGFRFSTSKEALLFWKWVYWKKGISTKVFRQEWLKDVADVMEINSAIDQKEMREREIQKMVSKIRR